MRVRSDEQVDRLILSFAQVQSWKVAMIISKVVDASGQLKLGNVRAYPWLR